MTCTTTPGNGWRGSTPNTPSTRSPRNTTGAATPRPISSGAMPTAGMRSVHAASSTCEYSVTTCGSIRSWRLTRSRPRSSEQDGGRAGTEPSPLGRSDDCGVVNRGIWVRGAAAGAQSAPLPTEARWRRPRRSPVLLGRWRCGAGRVGSRHPTSPVLLCDGRKGAQAAGPRAGGRGQEAATTRLRAKQLWRRGRAQTTIEPTARAGIRS